MTPGAAVEGKPELSDDQIDALIEECEIRENWWVNILYSVQPIAREAKEGHLSAVLPEFRACIEGHGMALEGDMSLDELLAAHAELQEEARLAGDHVNCLAELGFDGY